MGEKRENCKRRIEENKQKDDEKRETFLSRYAIPLSEAEPSRSTHTANKVSQNLTFWIKTRRGRFATYALVWRGKSCFRVILSALQLNTFPNAHVPALDILYHLLH